MSREGLLEAKIAIVKLKHGIVRKWLIKQEAPYEKFEILDRFEKQALSDLQADYEAYNEIVEVLDAHETQLVDSCHTETGYAGN